MYCSCSAKYDVFVSVYVVCAHFIFVGLGMRTSSVDQSDCANTNLFINVMYFFYLAQYRPVANVYSYGVKSWRLFWWAKCTGEYAPKWNGHELCTIG